MPPQTLSPRAMTWLGALFGVVGLVILLVALRIIPAAESKFQAPHWVVGAAGLAFFLVGILLLIGPPLPRLYVIAAFGSPVFERRMK